MVEEGRGHTRRVDTIRIRAAGDISVHHHLPVLCIISYNFSPSSWRSPWPSNTNPPFREPLQPLPEERVNRRVVVGARCGEGTSVSVALRRPARAVELVYLPRARQAALVGSPLWELRRNGRARRARRLRKPHWRIV